jgi:hypothetical protein
MPQPEQDMSENLSSNQMERIHIAFYLKRNVSLRNGREVSPAGDKPNGED